MKTIKVWVLSPAAAGRGFRLQWVDPFNKKRRTVTISATTEKAAQKAAMLKEVELEAGAPDMGRIHWGEFRERYEAEALGELAPQTRRKVLGVLDSLERVLDIAEDTELGELNADRLSAYKGTMLKGVPLQKGKNAKAVTTPRSKATVAGHLAHIRAALSWAVDVGMLATVPVIRKPKRTGKAKKNAPNKMKGRPVAGEEYERMLGKVESVVGAETAQAWRWYLEGLWWSGLRLGESLNLYWEAHDDRISIDLTERHPVFVIPAECQKSGEETLTPVAPEFAQFLLAVPEAERHGRVFRLPGLGGGPPSADWVSRTVTKIGKAAGVKVKDKDGKVKFASAHDFRRAFGERWSTRVMPAVLQELMRHESIETTMRYYVGRNAKRTARAVWAAFEALNVPLNADRENTQAPVAQSDRAADF